MLESLNVRNYVLIDNLELEFENGFSCITGETGSGKSIILGALSLLLGGKADKETIRAGAAYAQVSGRFSSISCDVASWCEAHGIVIEDDSILINRIIKANGRSSYTVNGVPITKSEGSEFGAMLIDIASQHARESLMKDDVLMSMLDMASGSSDILNEYRNVYSEYKKSDKALKELEAGIAKATEEQEYLKFCLNELDKADLKIGEEDKLKEKAAVIGASEFIAETLYKANEELSAASSSVSDALMLIEKAVKKDSTLSQYSERLESDSIELDDLLHSLKSYLSNLSYSEDELDSVNARLSEIQRIKRRFGGSEEQAIKIREDYREKINACEKKDEILSSMTEDVSKLKKRAERLASDISAMRKKGAESLSERVERNLHELGMSSARFMIRVQESGALGASGSDAVSFRIIANKGERESDIQNSSSGGELSRILLALKVAIGNSDSSLTMIFDEIDSGLGGVTANSVADKLSELSSMHQVFAITHLAQIAARAAEHYKVYKEEVDGRTISMIRKIDGEERVLEIARLLSGDESSISIEHARTLLEESRKS